MGKSATGEKPKFDLITASKTKKYKIITAVVLLIGVAFLGLGWLLKSTVTAAVTPNDLTIMEGTLSNYDGTNCILSQDEAFVLSTGTLPDSPLSDPIIFTLDAGASRFVQIYDSKMRPITQSNYQGLFYLHIFPDTPEFIDNGYGEMVRPSGNLIIRCGSHVIQIKLTYHKDDKLGI